ncbi:PREDICTED: G-box-binding factor 4-like [Fragaria vesca subsp. vesca]|uniref:G-box-binding factor 4-like n=1 Tax=Fragaria vesca subsp. vesca TaxID=101020 RepID=UPI0002C32C51|nr:PREDICTED: G-box-binding factor 4-like [Fragaria vesca subsp. vesca]
MASSKLISSSASSSRSRNSDLSRRPKPKPSPPSSPSAAAANQALQTTTNGGSYIHTANPAPMTVDGLFRDVYSNTLPPADAQITLMDSAGMEINSLGAAPSRPKTVDEVWEEIVSGESRRECKEELPDEMMTLEDFLARAGAVEENDVKDLHLAPPPETERLCGGLSGGMFGFDQIALSPFPSIEKMEGSIAGFGNGAAAAAAEVAASGGRGRGKRARAVLEPLDKAAQQRQKRMIKNRESAARSRERKQAYQVELESMAVKLEVENEQLLREEAERTEERLKQLMENIIPVVEKRRPSRVLRRVCSLQW